MEGAWPQLPFAGGFGVLLKLATLRQSQALNPETAALLGALNGKKVKSQGLSSRNGN